jgi:hypothetical protein
VSSRTPQLLVVAAVCISLSSGPAGAQWRVDGAPVCTATSNQFTPTIVADGTGGAIVAWYDYRGSSADIYALRVQSSGAAAPVWPAQGRLLCAAAGGQYSPASVSDGAGGSVVAWQDERGSNADVYAQRVLASGAVDPAWPVNGRGVCTASADQVYPAITSDAAGGAIITWRDYRGGPDTDVYAQRVLVSGAVDPSWPADGRAVCTAANNQSVPAIAGDGGGGALITWSDLRNGTDSDIYAQHVLSSGAVDPAWPANGRALCTAAGNQSGPTISSDGAGGALVTWFDYRNGVDSDIYVQHVLASGAADPAWPAGGRALCIAPGEQYSPIIVTVGAGGGIVVWYDYRGGVESDIYTQHVLPSGSVDPSWPTDGRALCVAGGDQLSPSIIADGAGGALVAWYDYRPGASTDVYAQHVMAMGAVDPAWPADGQLLCAAAGDQYSPAIVGDGAGGAIATWTDYRGGIFSDVYAERAYAGGGAADVTPQRDAPGSLLSIDPVPARAAAHVRLVMTESGPVTIQVLDAAGRRIRTILSRAELSVGSHAFAWDGVDEHGVPQKSGVYWVRANAPARSFARRLVLLR